MAHWGSQLAAERLGPLLQATIPTPATAAQFATSITFVLSDYGGAFAAKFSAPVAEV